MDTHVQPITPACAPRGPDPEAGQAAAWAGVVHALCAHRADLMPRLTTYLAAHPPDPVGRCLAGFLALMSGRSDRLADAAAAESAARAIVSATGGAREHGLLAALGAWREDRPLAAAAALDRVLARDPRDLLAIKLQHALYLMTGAPARMRRSLELVLPAWSASDEGAGFVFGCYAFSLEETGEFTRAEAAGRRAVALQPDDAWAIHAVTHVFESQGRAHEGLNWLAQQAPGYAGCNGFLGHVHWHRALLHVQLGEFGEALDIFDAHVATPWTGDYRDMANAVSLLWRLESDGLDVGARWQGLARIAAERATDHRSAFALAHYVAALAHGGDASGLARALALVSSAVPGGRVSTGQAAAVADVARPLCQGIAALHSGDASEAFAVLSPIQPQLLRLGGSNAQRDLFVLMFVECALAAGEVVAARRILEARQRLRPHDPWIAARLHALGHRASVAADAPAGVTAG